MSLLHNRLFVFSAVAAGILCFCFKKDQPARYKTKNVVIIVVDGARYTETWGNSQHLYIPHLSAMLEDGVTCASFYNDGVTYTDPGHTAIATGVYQEISNNGTELPQQPSLLQLWRKASHEAADKACLITSKDKLEILSDCQNAEWKGQFRPMADCGNSGIGSGYRDDSLTFRRIRQVLRNDHPHLLMINFKQPDAAGHAANYRGYLRGIVDTDNYIYQLWLQLQSDPLYKDQTTLFVTNDHGRHTAGHLDGFISHGDGCEGCRHIEMFASGPDFKKNFSCSTRYSQIDIASTVAELMGFEMPFAKGAVMKDLFR